MPQFDDDIYLGAAQSYAGTNQALNPAFGGNPAPMDSGFGPMGRIYLWDVVPLALNNAGLSASAVVTSAVTLAAGTGVTKVTRSDGTTAYQMDVPRGVSVTAVAGASSVNLTVNGYDLYGQPMSEIIGVTASTTVNGKKAFYQVTSASVSATTTNAISLGTSNVLGLPAKISDLGYILDVGWGNTLAADSGTAVAGLTASTQLVSGWTIAAPGVLTVAVSPVTGTLVQITGTPPGGTTVSSNYYWINASGTTGKLATSQANALAGTAVTSTGSYSANAASLVVLNTSTQLTPDVRGTYTPSTAADGIKRLVMGLGLTAIQVGPQAVRSGLLGADQA